MGCTESFKQCQADRSAMIDTALADPANAGKANRVLADELGVDPKAIRNHRATKEDASSNYTPPKGYDPRVKTPLVKEFVALWKQMDADEQDHVIRLIVGYKQGKRVS